MTCDNTLTVKGKHPGQAIMLAAASTLTAAILFSPSALFAQVASST